MTRERLAGWATNAAVALALGMLAFRFWQLGLAPFIMDEPIFLATARAQLQPGGHWASSMPIPGTHGAFYGPSVIWFYGAVGWAFGPEPRAAVLATCLLVSLANLALALAVTRAVQGGRLVFAAVLALIASSSYLFFWSRLAWDGMSISCACLAVALVARADRFGPWRAVALGAVLGLAVSAHLMAVPLLPLMAALLVVDLWRTPLRLLGLGALSAGALLLVNAPYLLFLSRQPARPGLSPGFQAERFLTFLGEPAHPVSTWDVSVFFESEWGAFLASLGSLRQVLEPSRIDWGTCLGLGALGLLVGLVAGGARARRLALLSAVGWLGYAVFCTLVSLEPLAHYQWPIWWVIPVGVACGLAGAWRASPRLGALLSTLVLGFAALRFALIAAWMGYVGAHDGIRGIHYSTPVASLEEAVREACAVPAPALALANATRVMEFPLSYLISVVPECQGKRVVLCRPGPCAAPPGGRLLTLVYTQPTGGAVTWR